jgi:hypothetical protein
MDRQDVYKIIDNEREFQDTKWRHRPALPVADELLIMHSYFNRAMFAYIGVMGETLALDKIRKVVAIGIRCLENNEKSNKVRR